MYAVIKTGGKQYRVAADDVITIEKVSGDAGAKIEFGEVLMIGGGSDGAKLKGRTRSGGFIASTRQIVNPRQTLPGFDPGQRQRRNCLRIFAQPGRLRWRLSDAEPLRTVGIGRATHFRHETLGRRS